MAAADRLRRLQLFMGELIWASRTGHPTHRLLFLDRLLDTNFTLCVSGPAQVDITLYHPGITPDDLVTGLQLKADMALSVPSTDAL